MNKKTLRKSNGEKKKSVKKQSVKKKVKSDIPTIFNLPTGYKNIPIYKIIYIKPDRENNNKLTEFKYIFVGNKSDKIKLILKKLEENGRLEKKDSNELDKEIRNWQIQFGELKKNKNKNYYKFINDYIDDNMIIKHLFNIINNKCDDNITSNNIYSWYYPLNISQEKYYKIIDYLFIDGQYNELTKKLIVNKSFFNERLKTLLQFDDNKISEISDKLFIGNETEYNHIFKSQYLRTFISNIPLSLSIEHYVVGDRKLSTFNNYNPYINNINNVNNNTNNTNNIDNLLSSDFQNYHINNTITEKILTSDGRILNNNIYVTTKDDLNYYYSDNKRVKYIIDYYISNEKTQKSVINLSNLFNYNYNIDTKTKLIANLEEPISVSIKKLYFEVNNKNNKEYIDLFNVYKLFRTSKLIPIVKINTEELVQVKSYIPFIKSFQTNYILKMYNDSLDKLFDKYIKFIGYYNRDIHFNIYLFGNTNLYINLHMSQYVSTNVLRSVIKVINLLIKHIKKKIKLETLDILNIQSLFGKSNVSVPNTNLIDTSVQYKYKLKNNVVNNDLFKSLIMYIRKNNYYFNIIQTVIEPNINLIYKGLDDFYSDKNMKKLISNIYRKKGYLSKKDKQELAANISNIFLISKADSEKFINDQDLQELKSKKESINGVSVNINITRNVITINIDNVTNYKYVNQILSLINHFIYLYINKSDDDEITNKNTIKYDINDNLNNLDVGDIDLSSIDIDVDNINVDDIDVDGIDYQSLNYDDEEITDIDNFKDNEESISDKEIIDIDIFNKPGKQNKLTYTQYMKLMRESADKFLFDEDPKYVTDCGNNVMRQPFILTDNEIKAIKNPKAITGYIKYRGNNYICPRIYDVISKQPISVEDFINNGFRSPYSGGKAIPYDARNKYEFNNEYSVIIRRPSSDIYWSKPSAEAGWPDILHNTGYDGFPGLSVIKENKHGLCRPCCFKNIPEGFVQNTLEVKHLDNYKGKYKCGNNLKDDENDKTENTKLIQDDNTNLICKLQSYILDDTSDLENCRLGLLPENLDLLLSNNQVQFLSSDRKRLKANSNLFLRRGVLINKSGEYYKGGNFIECISTIRGINNINTFKVKLVEELSVYKFIKLNNGNLISIYKSNDLLPNKDNMSKFKDFLKNNKELTYIYNIDDKIIDKLHKIIKCNQHNNDDKNSCNDNVSIIKKIIMLYGIFTAYDNYTSNLLSTNSHIDYRHYIDLISQPSDFLFKTGVNIIFINKDTNKLLCNPYINDNYETYILLIQDNDIDNKYAIFTPVFHIILKNGLINSNGLLTPGKHMTDVELSNKSLVESINTRPDKLRNLTEIYKFKCVNNLLYPSTNGEVLELLNNIKIKYQVVNLNNEIIYFIDNNDNFIPIYPINIIYHYIVKIYSEIEERIVFKSKSTLLEKWDFYLKFANEKFMQKYKYKPNKLVVDRYNNINGIQLENDLIIPVFYNDKNLKELVNKYGNIELIHKPIEYFGSVKNDKAIVKHIINYRKIDDNIKLTQLIYQDLLYQNYKYEFSNHISNNKFQNYKTKLIGIINSDEDRLSLLINLITEIMSKYITIVDNNNYSESEIIKGISFGKCSNINNKKRCDTNPFCEFASKCKLKMENKYIETFSHMLAKDILNSTKHMDLIISGKFIPKLLLSNKLLAYPDEFISDMEDFSNDIYLIKKNKHKSSSSLTDYLNMEKEVQDITNKDINKLEKIIKYKESFKVDKFIEDLTELTTAYIIPRNIITATSFDSDGKYNYKMRSGSCIFPYLDTSTYKLKYNCKKNKHNMLVCPVAVDENRKPYRWGYCPEDPDITRARKKIININTVGDKKKYFPGTCNLPYLLDEDNGKQLHYECKKESDNGLEYSWCPIKFKRGANNLIIPIAAKNMDDIYQKKWKTNNMYISKSKDIHPDFLKSEKKGYCQPPNEYDIIKKNIKQIKFNEYNPNHACNTPSKGGYKKEELYLFGLNELHIPNTIMRNKDIIKPKDYLCKFINDKYYEVLREKQKSRKKSYKKGHNKVKKSIKKSNQQNDNINIENIMKSFDPIKCNVTPDRGGYPLLIIKKLAIYLGLNSKLKKKELCKLIYKEILNRMKDNGNNKEDKVEYGIDPIYLNKMKSLSQLIN